MCSEKVANSTTSFPSLGNCFHSADENSTWKRQDFLWRFLLEAIIFRVHVNIEDAVHLRMYGNRAFETDPTKKKHIKQIESN